MKENDYYGHYKAFVNELKHNPGQTLQIYCREHCVVWRRLYDWMRRHHISLKRIYQTYRGESVGAGPYLSTHVSRGDRYQRLPILAPGDKISSPPMILLSPI